MTEDPVPTMPERVPATSPTARMKRKLKARLSVSNRLLLFLSNAVPSRRVKNGRIWTAAMQVATVWVNQWAVENANSQGEDCDGQVRQSQGRQTRSAPSGFADCCRKRIDRSPGALGARGDISRRHECGRCEFRRRRRA